MAASVWINSSRLLGMPTSALDRFRVLTMPRVTVLSSPRGLPTAIAQSPTCTWSESPRAATGRESSPSSIFTTARSVTSSAPSTVPSKRRPSLRVTVTRSAPFTTWALVRMSPSGVMMKPDPWPRSNSSRGELGKPPGPPKKSRKKGSSNRGLASRTMVFSVSIRTTAGPTCSTATATKLRGTVAVGALGRGTAGAVSWANAGGRWLVNTTRAISVMAKTCRRARCQGQPPEISLNIAFCSKSTVLSSPHPHGGDEAGGITPKVEKLAGKPPGDRP